MVTEDDLQAMLDADPTDFLTRLVLADWLEDRGDERAAGYRALAILRAKPFPCDPEPPRYSPDRITDNRPPHERKCFYGQASEQNNRGGEYAGCYLPDDWFGKLAKSTSVSEAIHSWVWIITRRAAENAAALAFLELPADRQTEILNLSPAEESHAAVRS